MKNTFLSILVLVIIFAGGYAVFAGSGVFFTDPRPQGTSATTTTTTTTDTPSLDGSSEGEFDRDQKSTSTREGNTSSSKVKRVSNDGFTARVKYQGEQTWRYTVMGTLPNPCYSYQAQTRVAESFPEQVFLTMNVTPPEEGQPCTQVLQKVEIGGTYRASEEARFSFDVIRQNQE